MNYDEFLPLMDEEAFSVRVRVATIVACDKIRAEADTTALHAQRVAWAKRVLRDPDAEATVIKRGILAQFRGMTANAIKVADDNAVQSAVDGYVNTLL